MARKPTLDRTKPFGIIDPPHNGWRYEQNGSYFDTSEAFVCSSGNDGPAQSAGTGGPSLKSVVLAIKTLEPGNPDHWTDDGKPDANELSDILDARVSAALRDKAWETVKPAEQPVNDDEDDSEDDGDEPEAQGLKELSEGGNFMAFRNAAWDAGAPKTLTKKAELVGWLTEEGLL